MSTYRVSNFAELAGVTVRTLQYYDRIGLLKPSATTEGGHRLYEHHDLLHLQQILTLKWMGFSLEDIKNVLESPSYNLHESLAIQKSAVQRQIARLQDACTALETAIQIAQKVGSDEVNPDTVSVIIRAVISQSEDQWIKRYYSDEAWLAIQTRRLSFTPEDQLKAQQAWQAIYAAFEELQSESPKSEAVQKIAKQAFELGQQFTKGDPAIEQGLRQFIADAHDGNLPPDYHGHNPFANIDDDLQRFMQKAMEIYQENLS